MMSRVGVVGDIHCEDARLDSALRFFAKQRLDGVLAVGDLADGHGSLDRCCQLLAAAGALVVRGNHDRWLLDGTLRDLPQATAPEGISEGTREYLRALPPTRVLDSAAGRLLLCHGLGEDDMAQLRPDDHGYALESNRALQAILGEGRVAGVIGGHTHRRMARRLGAVWFLNAGTLHRAYGPGFVVVDLAARVAQFYDLLDEEEIVPADRREL
jgi:predicted phosphodiesterase